MAAQQAASSSPSPASAVRYSVLLFGDVKAHAGVGALEVDGPAGGGLHTAASLIDALRDVRGVRVATPPGAAAATAAAAPRAFAAPHAWADLVRPAVLAVNMEYVSADGLGLPIPAGSEIALIPPISGG